MNARRVFGWLLGISVVGAALAIFFSVFEKQTFDVPVGLRGEAAKNRYLAAERLLEAMGLETRSFASPSALSALPPLDGTLILPTPRVTLAAARSRELLAWAESGGSLIVLTWTLWDDEERRPDPILDPLGIHQFMHVDPEASALEDANAPLDGYAPFPGEIARVDARGRDGSLEVEFDPRYTLVDSEGRATWSASDQNGTHMLQLPLGHGLLTVLTDDYFLTTASIALYDHAELVYRLAKAGGRSGPVWIVYLEDWPGPWELLVRYGWTVLISLGVLVAAWIWSVSPRFGPLLPDEPLERRRLMEHIEASGRFHWRHGGANALLAAERAALLERVHTRHPGWAELPPRELNERLAELSQIPRERIDRAMAFRAEPQPEHFAQNIATLEKVRTSL